MCVALTFLLAGSFTLAACRQPATALEQMELHPPTSEAQRQLSKHDRLEMGLEMPKETLPGPKFPTIASHRPGTLKQGLNADPRSLSGITTECESAEVRNEKTVRDAALGQGSTAQKHISTHTSLLRDEGSLCFFLNKPLDHQPKPFNEDDRRTMVKRSVGEDLTAIIKREPAGGSGGGGATAAAGGGAAAISGSSSSIKPLPGGNTTNPWYQLNFAKGNPEGTLNVDGKTIKNCGMWLSA